MMRNIAIIEAHSTRDCYDDYGLVIDRVTDFTEVDEETFQILVQESYRNSFHVISQPIGQEEFIANTVKGYLDRIDKEKKKLETQERARKKLVEANKEKQRAKKAAAEQKLLDKLLAERGLTIVPKT